MLKFQKSLYFANKFLYQQSLGHCLHIYQKYNFSEQNEEKNKQNNKQEKIYYDSKISLSFTDGKYLISKSNTNEITNFKKFQVFALYPLNAYFGYKAIKSFLNGSSIKLAFWLALTIAAFRINYGVHYNLVNFINEISLLEGGNKTEISLFNSSKIIIVDNSKIKIVGKKEINSFLSTAPHVFDRFFPIIVDEEIFFMSKECEITKKDILAEILKGNYIKYNNKKI